MDRVETLKIKNCLKSWHFSIDSKILLTTLNGNEKLLYITFCSYLSPSGDTCFPSIKRLTLQMTCSRATVFRTLLELEKKGIIIRHEQFGEDGRQICTLYEIHEIPEEYFIHPESEKSNNFEKNASSMGSQIETEGSHFDTGGVSKRDGGSLKLRHNHLPKEYIPKEIIYKPNKNLTYQRKQKTGSIKEVPETFGFTLDDVLRAYRLGGEDPEDLPILCEMYKLSEAETIKAFEACGVGMNEEADLIAFN